MEAETEAEMKQVYTSRPTLHRVNPSNFTEEDTPTNGTLFDKKKLLRG